MTAAVAAFSFLVVVATTRHLAGGRLPFPAPPASIGTFLAAATLATAFIAYPLVRIPRDPRLFETFSPEFAGAARRTSDILLGSADDRAWEWRYGTLQPNLALVLSAGLGMAGVIHPDLRAVAFVHAGLNALALLLTLALVYAMAAGPYGRGAGVVAALVYLAPYTVFHRTVHPYGPDHLQQIFVCLGIAAAARLARDGLQLHAWLAGVCAGIQFGTKYLGIVFLALPALLILARPGRPADSPAGPRGRRIGLLLAGFAAGFALASPQAAADPPRFLAGLRAAASSVDYSPCFSDGVAAAYGNLFRADFLGGDPAILTLVAAGVVLLARHAASSRAGGETAKASLGWLLVYLSFLALRLRYLERGIFLPVWPVLATGAGLAARSLAFLVLDYLYFRRDERAPRRATFALLIALLLLHELLSPSAAFAPVRIDRSILYDLHHPHFAGIRTLAALLESRYPPDTPMIADQGQIHVPSRFGKVYRLSFKAGADRVGSAEVALLHRRDPAIGEEARILKTPPAELHALCSAHERIRRGGEFRKIAEVGYPPCWLDGPVEVWERRGSGESR